MAKKKKQKQEETPGIEAKVEVFRFPPAYLQFGLSLLLSTEGKKPVGGIISMGYKSGEGLFIQSDTFRILFLTNRQEQEWELKMEATDTTMKSLSALTKLIGSVKIAPDIELQRVGEKKLKVRVGKLNSTLNVDFPDYKVSGSYLSVEGFPLILEFPLQGILLDALENSLACAPQMKEFEKSGILITGDNQAVEVLSTDGRQLYRHLIPVKDGIFVRQEGVKFWTLPQEAGKLVKVMREFPKDSRVVFYENAGNCIAQLITESCVASLLVRARQEDNPPDFDRLIKNVNSQVKTKVCLGGDGTDSFQNGIRILQKSLPRNGAVYVEFSKDGGYLKTYSDEIGSETEGEYVIEPECIPGLPQGKGVGGWWNGKAIYEFIKQVSYVEVEFSSVMQVPVAGDVEGMGILKLSNEGINGDKMELYIAPYRIDTASSLSVKVQPAGVESNSEVEENDEEQEVEDEGETDNPDN